jgi:hypothetical protein
MLLIHAKSRYAWHQSYVHPCSCCKCSLSTQIQGAAFALLTGVDALVLPHDDVRPCKLFFIIPALFCMQCFVKTLHGTVHICVINCSLQ